MYVIWAVLQQKCKSSPNFWPTIFHDKNYVVNFYRKWTEPQFWAIFARPHLATLVMWLGYFIFIVFKDFICIFHGF
jgi:hypothetical protein